MSRQRLIIGVSGDLVAQTAGKILDQFAIGHTLFRRWDGTSPAPAHETAAVGT